MYVDYVVNTTNSTYTEMASIFTDLSKIFDGTHTDKTTFDTTVCNISLSTFEGTLPAEFDTSSIILDVTSTSTENIFLKFIKKHEQADATYDYKRQFALYWNNSDEGLRMRMEDPAIVGADDGNTAFNERVPYLLAGNVTSNHYSHGNDSSGPRSVMRYAANIDRIRIYATKSYVIIQFTEGVGDVAYTFSIFDKDVTAFDEYAYSLDSNYAPMVCMSNIINDFANTIGNSNDYNEGWTDIVCASTHLRVDGTIHTRTRNFSDSNGELYAQASFFPYHYTDNADNNYNNTLTLMPFLGQAISRGTISGVDSHVVLPVFVTCAGSGLTTNNTTTPMMHGQIPRFYRTSNELAAPGTTVTQDGIDYVVLALNYSGGQATNSANDGFSCYLVPKTAGDA